MLNGIEFRTRHNDYLLNSPHKTSSDYHEVEEIPYPEVPPSVLEKTSVEDQIEEMKAYFKAWKEQDTSVRDYRPYFKPLLSYMEGAWTFPDGEDIEEPYASERHWLDVETWRELEDAEMFTSYAGTKDPLENYGYFPRSIVDVDDDCEPVLAQWNYRILCHELERDLRTDRFRVVDDLASRMSVQMSLEDFAQTR